VSNTEEIKLREERKAALEEVKREMEKRYEEAKKEREEEAGWIACLRAEIPGLQNAKNPKTRPHNAKIHWSRYEVQQAARTMAGEGAQFPSGVRIPYLHRSITQSGDDTPPIGAECCGENPASMPQLGEYRYFLGRRHAQAHCHKHKNAQRKNSFSHTKPLYLDYG
jgi:hypothetical protein